MMTPVKPTFRLFIACEDQAAFSQAKKVENQVQALFGDEIQISRLLWNFALLRHEQLQKHAVMEAADAEMIVISFRATGELPPHVKSWIESLPVRREAGQGALVALIGSEHKAQPEWQPHIDYLRGIAENRGLDFFCNRGSWTHFEFSKPALQDVESSLLSPGNNTDSPILWYAEGINE